MSPVPTDDERRRFEAAQAAVADMARRADEARVSLFEAREGLKRAKRAGPLRSRATRTSVSAA